MRRAAFVFCLLALGAAAEEGDAERDLRCVRGWAESFKALMDRAEARPGLFAEKPEAWTLDDDREIRCLWRGVLDHVYALEGTRRLYAGDPKAFGLFHAAALAQYAEGLRWLGLTQGKKRLETLLDEPDPEQGTPKGAFADLKFRLIHVGTIARFLSQDRRFRKMEGKDPWLAAYGEDASGRIRAILNQRGLQDLVANGADILGDAAFELWFPAQKNVAEWMGDTKVCRIKTTLVKPGQVRKMAERMMPGDVLVERRNWYLSNVGLPGFWPHAVLYVGTPEELSRAFDLDSETRDWMGTLPGHPETFAQALEKAVPGAWKAYLAKAGDGNLVRVMEAVSEGVVFNSAEESCCGDYVAAIRPRLFPADKAKALLEAFRHYGKPYDFNFDFVTDSALVCSELVWKAYLPGKGKEGLKIPLVDVCGRRTLPPNELVRIFDEEADREARQFDFVWFLDGREGSRDAVPADEAAFRSSWKRPKWDLAQK